MVGSFVYSVFLCLSASLISTTQDDLVGCGGFVRSKYLTNFSRIKVNLYAKSGAIKCRTECAPNNGYFLIPLYDKGEYVLKVEPPAGWIFEPSEVSLAVDGKTDLCSRGVDINFNHIGFSLFGQGEGVGGAQVFVNGYMTATTEEDGTYTLSNITSGSYHLLVEADRLEFEEKVVTITPSEPYLPDLTPVRFQVCGRVVVSVVPPSSSSPSSGGRQVKVVASERDTLLSATTDQAGQFCVMLRPAHYSFSPEVSPAERGWGLVFAPPTRDLEVLSSPSSSLTFSQFTTSLSGTLSLMILTVD